MQSASSAPHAAPASPSSAPPPPGGRTPFALSPSRDDTALYQDARAGFSHLLPGRPTLGTARPGDPPSDAVIYLQDAPITIRYRLEPPSFAAASAGDLARGTAERFRARASVTVDWANESWLAAWGVEAAAVAAYDVPANPSVGTPPAREDLFVLVRQGMVMLTSWTYPRGFVDDPAYATFASVAEATMAWDPARWEQRGRVWPDSPFLGPGLFAVAKAKYNERSKEVATAAIPPEERAQILNILAGVISGAGAPWVPLAPQVVDGNKRAILSAVRDGRLRAFLDEAFLDVRSAHDLRGLAILLGRALDARRSTSSLPPPVPGAGPGGLGAPGGRGALRSPPAPSIAY
jgi:hypothetical protein